MEFSEADLSGWFTRNRMLFVMNRRHYTDDHIMHLAITAGFNRRMVYNRHIDYELAQFSIEKAARHKANWVESEILLQRDLSLVDQWKDLHMYLEEGLEFDELTKNRDTQKEMDFERNFQAWLTSAQT